MVLQFKFAVHLVEVVRYAVVLKYTGKSIFMVARKCSPFEFIATISSYCSEVFFHVFLDLISNKSNTLALRRDMGLV